MIIDIKWMILSLLIYFINASDCEALRDLMVGLGVAPRSEAITKCCDLKGIECMGESIIKINLTGEFNGNISDSIGKLTELKSLTLSKGISGEVPCSLSNLLKLEAVDLSENEKLSGFVYDHGNLKNITVAGSGVVNCFTSKQDRECVERIKCPPPSPPPPSTQQTEEQRKVESVYWLIPFSLTIIFSVLVVWYVYSKKSKDDSGIGHNQKPPTISRQPKVLMAWGQLGNISPPQEKEIQPMPPQISNLELSPLALKISPPSLSDSPVIPKKPLEIGSWKSPPPPPPDRPLGMGSSRSPPPPVPKKPTVTSKSPPKKKDDDSLSPTKILAMCSY